MIGIEWKEHTLIRELCRKEHLTFSSQEELITVLQQLFALYPAEFAFLSSLPHVLRSEEYLFVHGGILQEEEPYAQSPHDLMKNDYFATKDVRFQKTIVCGHTPVMNYDTTYFDCNPHFDREKNILSIDGGCGVKDFGQINIVVLNDQEIQYQYVDELPLEVIQTDFIPTQKDTHCIAWMDNKIEVLETKKDVASCRHCSSGVELDIPCDHLFKLADGWHTHDYSDFQLEVHKGDCVGVITTWNHLVYVKKDGILGWIPKTCLSHPNK